MRQRLDLQLTTNRSVTLSLTSFTSVKLKIIPIKILLKTHMRRNKITSTRHFNTEEAKIHSRT